MTKPHDSPTISDGDTIIRRVNPVHHVVPDHNTGGFRTSSKLFSPSSGEDEGMSVDLLELIKLDNVDAVTFLTTPVFAGSVKFTASAARNAGLMLAEDPLPENPYHGQVWGSNERPSHFTKSHKKALAEASEWFVEIPGVVISA